jgi:hypothetical protein
MLYISSFVSITVIIIYVVMIVRCKNIYILNIQQCTINKGNNKITELRAILQRESQNS